MGRFSTLFVHLGIASGLVIGATDAVAQQPLSVQAKTLPVPRQSVGTNGTVVLKAVPFQQSVERLPGATSQITSPMSMPKVLAPVAQASVPGVKVGYTFYDFQTNGAMPNRITFYREGAESYAQMFWMASKDPSRDATSRAPGYNNGRGGHYIYMEVSDPDNPTLGLPEFKKIDQDRTGWPSLIQFKDGSAATPSHAPVKFWRNGGVGDDNFFPLDVTVDADSAFWPRAAVDGQDYVHLIYNRRFSGTLINQIAYRRSTDAGDSWDQEVLLTGANAVGPLPAGTTLRDGTGGDSYAIAARGNTVVVAYIDAGLNIISRKSTDNGQTWDDNRLVFTGQHKFIDSVNYAQDSIRVMSDTVVGPTSNLDVMIDSEGRAHYIIGETLTYVIQKGLRTPSTSNPRSGTIYEVNDVGLMAGLGLLYYREGDSTLTRMGPAGGAEPWNGEGFIVSRRAYTGPSRYPQMGMDEHDNIYVTYAAPKNGDMISMEVDTTAGSEELTTLNGLYGHVYVTHKLKNYDTWSTPVNITPDGVNANFPTMCDVVNDRMYLGYSVNILPGDRVTNVELASDTAKVYFYPMKTSDLNVISSVQNERTLDAAITLSPNPANEIAHLSIRSVTNGTITVSVVTALGETIMQSMNPAGTGDWTVSIPTSTLATGTYYCLIEQNGVRTTRTLSVVR